eukprot:m.156095 g.156095  ORF g.156095 m.156095 type:complete len:82 (+) comp23608_c0_seq1:993-1238(+)
MVQALARNSSFIRWVAGGARPTRWLKSSPPSTARAIADPTSSTTTMKAMGTTAPRLPQQAPLQILFDFVGSLIRVFLICII